MESKKSYIHQHFLLNLVVQCQFPCEGIVDARRIIREAIKVEESCSLGHKRATDITRKDINEKNKYTTHQVLNRSN